MKTKKILISGYYGFDNFGDDAILQVLAESLKEIDENFEVTAISNNPEKIKQNYGIDSVKRFDFKLIISKMLKTDLFISGGGSLLQDVTSFKSLLYYLFLIFIAIFFGKKVYIYAQGIGPINNKWGRILTGFALKRVAVVTVRDKKSQDFLSDLGVNSVLTGDPVWGINIPEKDEPLLEKSRVNVGIQLRSWSTLSSDKIASIIKALNTCFDVNNTNFILISLQDSLDLETTKELEFLMKTINPEMHTNLVSDLSVNNAINLISSLDYLVAMRFHAVMVSLKAKVPTMAISYDPKVEILSKEFDIPYIKLDDFNQEKLYYNLSKMLNDKDTQIERIINILSKKELEARQNNQLLSKILCN